MPVLSYEFDSSSVDLKAQRASRRATSLHKDRSEYNKRSLVSYSRKVSAAPIGSDFANPHRAARAATRTCLANGTIASGSDMPQISMGRTGYWVRWVRKPSVSKATSLAIEEFEMDESLLAPGASYMQYWDTDVDTTPATPQRPSSSSVDIDLDNQETFPTLATCQAEPAKILVGAWAAKPESESSLEQTVTDLTPEKVSQVVAKDEPSREEAKDESIEDWVVVSPDDAKTAASACPSVAGREQFDRQHPRNMFAKKASPKPLVSNADSEEAGSGMDWSLAGMPTQLIKRLIRGNVNSAHHGPHAEKKASSLSIEVMRAQNVGSAKRERSTPKTPRSQSRGCAVRQPSGRR